MANTPTLDSDDISSISSTLSNVSFRGEDMDCNAFIDIAFSDAQDALNLLHSSTRALSYAEDRGDSYDEIKASYDELTEVAKDGIKILREIMAVNKQFLPPKPRAAATKK